MPMSPARTLLLAALALSLPAAPVAAADVTPFPLVVFCEFEGIAHAYYLSQVGEDGVAVYLTPDRQAGTISVEGTAQRVGGDRAGTCQDKTLAELRAAGQAVDVAR